MENLFELEVDESQWETLALGFVTNPAIQVDFFKFSQAEFKINFSQDERKIVTGPVLIPDLPIYRKIKNSEGFHVVLREEQVVKSYNLFMQKQRFVNMNLMHDVSIPLDNQAFMLECFITDPKRGIMAPKGYEDLPANTWFMSHQITSPELWAKIKSGEINGYSIEQNMSINQKDANALEKLMNDLKTELTF